jgi:protein-S-isoprenylcysteine O-methyltransferase Ste14
MRRVMTVLYGVVVYAFFLGTFLYAIGFVGNLLVPKAIDTGTTGPLLSTILIDAALLGLFAVQHSVMARPGFKRMWTRIVPQAVERSTYVLFATVALALICWQWRPITTPVWTVTDPLGVIALDAIFWLGWGVLLLATFLINHFELFGLRQVFLRFLNRNAPAPQFTTPLLYKYVRHPIYLGFLMSFWSTPTMTAGHLMFAVGTTGYILIGIWFEERDLIDLFGDRYRRYKEQVGMLFPRFRRRKSGEVDA